MTPSPATPTTAIDRLRRARGIDDHDYSHIQEFDVAGFESRLAGIEWQYAPDCDEFHTLTCFELSRSADDVCYYGLSENKHDAAKPIFLRAFASQPEPSPCRTDLNVEHPKLLGLSAIDCWTFERYFDRGRGLEGTVLLSTYSFGASLAALREADAQLSWPAACCIHAVVADPLRALHRRGRLHGALTAARIQLVLYPDVWSPGYSPIRLLAPRGQPGDAAAGRAELAIAASAIGSLTHHPDERVERLLRDPSPNARDILRDLVLERGEPVPWLLADL